MESVHFFFFDKSIAVFILNQMEQELPVSSVFQYKLVSGRVKLFLKCELSGVGWMSHATYHC